MKTTLLVAIAFVLALCATPSASAAYTSDASCNPEVPPLFCVTGSVHIYAIASDTPCYDAGDAKDPGEVCKAFVFSGTASSIIPGTTVELDGYGGHNELVDCDGSLGLISSICTATYTAYYFADSSHCTTLNLDGYARVAGVVILTASVDISGAC